jgi:hypothetical protein
VRIGETKGFRSARQGNVISSTDQSDLIYIPTVSKGVIRGGSAASSTGGAIEGTRDTL